YIEDGVPGNFWWFGPGCERRGRERQQGIESICAWRLRGKALAQVSEWRNAPGRRQKSSTERICHGWLAENASMPLLPRRLDPATCLERDCSSANSQL